MKTGCNECEYLTECEQRTISKYCICKECIKQESFDTYDAINKFSIHDVKLISDYVFPICLLITVKFYI
jgi:hypothetical protein